MSDDTTTPTDEALSPEEALAQEKEAKRIARGERAKNRKPRQKKWASEIARQAHSNQRRKLAREGAERELNRLTAARRELKEATRRSMRAEQNKRTNMVHKGLSPRLAAVMNSWGINVPFSIKPADSIRAFTDFDSITVRYVDPAAASQRLLNEDGFPVPLDPEDLRVAAAEVRAMFYHELGHVLFTVPFQDLMSIAAEMEGVDNFVAPHNIEVAGYVSGQYQHSTVASGGNPNGWAKPEYTRISPEAWASGQRPIIQEWDFPAKYHRAWNILEDQRMEALVLDASPHIATYLSVLVLNHIVTASRSPRTEINGRAWPLVAGRKYLPTSLRRSVKQAWAVDVPNGASANEVSAIVSDYCKATTAGEMLACIVRLVEAMGGMDLPNNVDEHGEMEGRWKRAGKNDEKGRKSLADQGAQADERDDDEEDEEDDSNAPSKDDRYEDGNPRAGAGDDDSDDDSEAEGGSGDDEADDDGDDEAEGGSKGSSDSDDEDSADDSDESGESAGSEAAEPTFPEAAQEALDEVMDEITDSEESLEDLQAMNSAYHSDQGLLPASSFDRPNNDAEMVAKAHAIVDDVVQSFRVATEDCAPHWETGQRAGVLEPIRYLTRQPGDLEIFRRYADDGDPGTDIAVTVFLDISCSMQGSGSALGAAAWAVKTACGQLDVDCDVNLFDTEGYTLWGTDEEPTCVPEIASAGGTDPCPAFDATLYAERSKKHHVVIIMTDGEWSDDGYKWLKKNRVSNQHVMGFYYSPSRVGQKMSPNHGWANRIGAQEGYNIGDLMDIPRALEAMLVSLVV